MTVTDSCNWKETISLEEPAFAKDQALVTRLPFPLPELQIILTMQIKEPKKICPQRESNSRFLGHNEIS
jgi:hypothetical protein